jgi:hypothetical protein
VYQIEYKLGAKIMGKQTFNRTKKTLIILLVVFCIISMTFASAAASWFSEEGYKIASGTHEVEKKIGGAEHNFDRDVSGTGRHIYPKVDRGAHEVEKK